MRPSAISSLPERTATTKKYHPYDETLPEGGAHDRDGGERYDRKKRGDDKNCSDFKTQAEAQAFFEESGGPDSDLHKLDRDKDGRVCETLP